MYVRKIKRSKSHPSARLVRKIKRSESHPSARLTSIALNVVVVNRKNEIIRVG